jgi:hypothetical protein
VASCLHFLHWSVSCLNCGCGKKFSNISILPENRHKQPLYVKYMHVTLPKGIYIPFWESQLVSNDCTFNLV